MKILTLRDIAAVLAADVATFVRTAAAVVTASLIAAQP